MRNVLLIILILITIPLVSAISVESGVNFIGSNSTYKLYEPSYDTEIYFEGNNITTNNIILAVGAANGRSLVYLLNSTITAFSLNATPSTASIHNIDLTNLNTSSSYDIYIDSVLTSSENTDDFGDLTYIASAISTLTNYLFKFSGIAKVLTYGCTDVLSTNRSIDPATEYVITAVTTSNYTFECQFPLLNRTQTNNLRKSCQWWSEPQDKMNYSFSNYTLHDTVTRFRNFNNGSNTVDLCNLTGTVWGGTNANETTFRMNFTEMPQYGNTGMTVTNNSLKILYMMHEIDTNKTIDI